jgi:ABC-2 type transport system permease protein
VLLKSAEEAENRRLNAKRELIMRDKVRAMERTESEHLAEVRKVEDWIRVLAVLVPPVPAILLGFFIFLRKRQREQDAIPSSRKRGSR